MDTNPSRMNVFHRKGIDTIAMDTYGLIANGAFAAGGGVTGATWSFLVRDLWPDHGRRQVSGPNEGGKTGLKQPLAHGCSPRDN